MDDQKTGYTEVIYWKMLGNFEQKMIDPEPFNGPSSITC
jgi:hypothetical protein